MKLANFSAGSIGQLSASGADIRALKHQFLKLGKNCKSCHRDYGKRKQQKR